MRKILALALALAGCASPHRRCHQVETVHAAAGSLQPAISDLCAALDGADRDRCQRAQAASQRTGDLLRFVRESVCVAR